MIQPTAVGPLDGLRRNPPWSANANANAVWSMAALPIRSVGTTDRLGSSPATATATATATGAVDRSVRDEDPVFSMTTIGYGTPVQDVDSDRLRRFTRAGLDLAATVSGATGNLGHRPIAAALSWDRFDGGKLSVWSFMGTLTDDACGMTSAVVRRRRARNRGDDGAW